ncbi:MAG: hypothetical protein LBC62_04345 [Treponema sp.]|jgi:hypothetical protein|nr:hypothetical protein [Treponema sp.]
MTVIFTEKKAAALGISGKALQEVTILPPGETGKYAPAPEDRIYLDISGLKAPNLKKALGQIKKKNVSWGIVDPKGESEDPAAFFFEGASDYLGPKILKAGLTKKRLAAAALWQARGASAAKEKESAKAPPAKEPARTGPKLQSGKFPGWSSIKPGTVTPFFFLFISIEGDSNIRARVGEAAFTSLKNRLRGFLCRRFESAKALLWMETEGNCLFLIPPRAALIREAVIESLKLLMAAPLIGIENLGLPFPVHFTIALHYGKTPYRAPGKTGNVISDAVNFIFHLGMKRAEKDRLTVSGETPREAIPEKLDSLFIDAGEYEGRSLRHSRRFITQLRPQGTAEP